MKRKKKYVKTLWETATYDVWGNAKDGYEVNNVFRSRTEIELNLPVDKFNIGTPQEFESAYPTDAQIREVFDMPRIQIDTDGDDLTVYVNRKRDGYPIGEMHCTSHESLSPIREKKAVNANAS